MGKNNLYDFCCVNCHVRKAIACLQTFYQPSKIHLNIRTNKPHFCDWCIFDEKFTWGKREFYNDYKQIENRIRELLPLIKNDTVKFHEYEIIWINMRAVEAANNLYYYIGVPLIDLNKFNLNEKFKNNVEESIKSAG